MALAAQLVGPGGPAASAAASLASPAPLASATATARLALPQRPFDPATWRLGGRDLVREATAKLDDLAFDPDLLARLGVTRLAGRAELPYRGRASAALAIGAAATHAELAVELRDVTGGALVAPVSQRVAVTAGPGGTRVHATSSGGTRRELALGALDGELAMPIDRWIADPAAALRAPLTARWTLAPVPIASVLSQLGRAELRAGTLEGSATVRGSLGAPRVDASLRAQRLEVVPRLGGRPLPVVERFALSAAWDGELARVAVEAREAGGGELRARAEVRPAAPAAATGTLVARRLDIAPIAVVLPSVVPALPAVVASAAGMLDADLTLRGGRLGGALVVRDGAFPVAPEIGTLRDARVDVEIDERTITGTATGRIGAGRIELEARAAIDDPGKLVVRLELDRVSPLVAMRPVLAAPIAATLEVGAARCAEIGHDTTWLCGNITVGDARVELPDQSGVPLLDAELPGDLVFVATPTSGAPAPDLPPGARDPGGAGARPWFASRVALGAIAVEGDDFARGVGIRATLRGRPRSDDRLRVALGDRVAIAGHIDVELADVNILGRSYRLDPGQTSTLQFDGTTDPELDLHLSYAFPSLTLGVAIAGRASDLRPRFSSEPGGYTQDQLFGFFLGGEPGGDPSSQAGEAVAGGATRFASGLAGRWISKALPIRILDTFSCELATSATAASGDSCTLGRWFWQRMFVAVRGHRGAAADRNTSEFKLQVRPWPKALFDLTLGDRGHHGADLLWHHRW